MSAAASVLVTGATGFIGRRVVPRLLAGGRSVRVLARPGREAGAAERVACAVGRVPDGERLAVIEADLAILPLDARAWASAGASVETVVHCAGDTAFFPDDPDGFRAGHVDGPVALLETLARAGRLRRWIHLSTAYVCGTRSGRVLETDGDVGQAFHNVYERVKLDAEGALRRAGARHGVEVCVLRPSIVVGAESGTNGSAPSGLFFEFVRLVAALARAPRRPSPAVRVPGCPPAAFNIVPVGYVSAALAALAGGMPAGDVTGHLVVAGAPTQAEMLARITGRLGVGGLSVVHGTIGDPSPLEARLGRLLAPYRDYLAQDVTFDDARARGVLDPRGVPRPALDDEAVRRLIDLALTTPAARPRPARALR